MCTPAVRGATEISLPGIQKTAVGGLFDGLALNYQATSPDDAYVRKRNKHKQLSTPNPETLTMKKSTDS